MAYTKTAGTPHTPKHDELFRPLHHVKECGHMPARERQIHQHYNQRVVCKLHAVINIMCYIKLEWMCCALTLTIVIFIPLLNYQSITAILLHGEVLFNIKTKQGQWSRPESEGARPAVS